MKTLNKKIIKNISKLLLVLFSFTMIGANGMTSASAAGATVSYKLSNTTVKVGDTVTIDVNVANASDLYGASFDFTYDKTLLQVTGITDGKLFSQTPVNNYSTQGKIEFATTNTGSKAGITGGKVLTITAKALKAGTVDFSKATVKLSNSSSAAISATVSATGATLKVTNGDDPVNTVTLKSLVADQKSGAPLGSTIKFTAETDDTANSMFQFWVKLGTGTWTKISEWQTSNSVSWKPANYGNYTIRVHAKHKTASTSQSYKDMFYNIKNDALMVKIQSLTPDKASSQPLGTTITFTATTDRTSISTFEFWVKEGSTWVKKQPWSADNKFVWTPTAKGTYTIRVHAKHKNYNTSDGYKDLTYIIK